MNPDRFAATRPYAYHLTSAVNRLHLAELGTIFATKRIIEEATSSAPALDRRRPGLVRVTFREREVVLRDQFPLHAGNTGLLNGFTFGDFVTLLNAHVFFWPGTYTGPNGYGERHAQRYAQEDVVFLRVPTTDLLASNPGRARVCRYNSGSPRCSGGKPSPRGPGTFVPLATTSLAPSSVVELVFPDEAALPRSTQWAKSLRGSYTDLFR